ncbi:MAG TPA: excinuclease ABC subunit UvrB [Dictyoglomaceae bacterium]|mgnify:CR=1 FL=1|nr:excinuclease ABC subunit UvrB [Dictyoglomaceae bacterium]HOL40042.1 excinuclease ABC subunit UvrB [Dictyoglomaceae bacterium]HPP16541.1 excinuclease ABC subunit UvrB [Dictyoglomaceae bacterium]
MSGFILVSEFKPCGDQPQAIEKLTEGVKKGLRYQTLIGVTGSGKTFTMANIIANVQKPTLVIAPNKTLAAQLYSEFKEFFPYNAVEYFVSYYDYYQPEAYIPQTDTYIEKDADINDRIDRLRHRATSALLSRRDVIVVASVSCIYGLGSPEDYENMVFRIGVGEEFPRDLLLRKLVKLQYERNDYEFTRGKFRVRGDVVEIFPIGGETAIRVEYWGDTVEKIVEFDPVSGKKVYSWDEVFIYPATHYVAPAEKLERAMESIKKELEERVEELKGQGKFLEAKRLEARTMYDLELLREIGYCKGIENYSRHLDGRKPGEPPYTLLDYFPDDFLLFIDESHLTIPQIRAMYNGDRARKDSLVEYGFRLPSAYDNRPLLFEEFWERIPQVIFVSATPAEFEFSISEQVVEQLVRPTGLLDPEIEVHPTEGQIEHLVSQIKEIVSHGERALVTTLTKRTAEDLAEYLSNLGVKVTYLHSEIETFERTNILQDLRLGKFDVLVGINLLREGLDLPEVSLIAILDADREGFLRSERSLIQVMGRAARNVNGKVIMYADTITDSMRRAIEETERRRKIQMEYNKANGIVPRSIKKSVKEVFQFVEAVKENQVDYKTMSKKLSIDEIEDVIKEIEKEMYEAAAELDFERAAYLRNQIKDLKEELKRKTKL